MFAEQYDYKKITIASIVAVLIIASFIGTGFFFISYKNTQAELENIKKNPQEAIKKENEDLITQVRGILDVPAEEVPTVAVINDLEPLKNQPFFTKAKIGDRLLVFNQSKKAVLYDPINKKILEIAPLDNAPSPEVAGEETGPFSLPTVRPTVIPTRTPTPTIPPPSPASSQELMPNKETPF